MLRTRPSWRPRAASTIPSTPEIPAGAWAPTVSSVLAARRDRVPAAADEPRRLVGGGRGDHVAGREVRPHPRVARGRGRRPRAQRRLGGGEHGELAAVDGDLRPVDGEHGPDAAQLAQPGQVGPGHAARHRGDDVGHDQAGGGGAGEGGARRRVAAAAAVPAAPLRLRCAGAALAVAAAGSAPADGAGPPESAATRAATAAQRATSPPPTTAGLARRLTLSSLTVRSTLQSLRGGASARPDRRRASCCYPIGDARRRLADGADGPHLSGNRRNCRGYDYALSMTQEADQSPAQPSIAQQGAGAARGSAKSRGIGRVPRKPVTPVARRRRARPGSRAAGAGPGDGPQAARRRHDRVRGARLRRRPGR